MAQAPDHIVPAVELSPGREWRCPSRHCHLSGKRGQPAVGDGARIRQAYLFGATGLVSAFEVANIVPTMFFDLLVGGMISSALVPVLSEYAESDRQDEFWRLVSTLLSLAGRRSRSFCPPLGAVGSSDSMAFWRPPFR